MACAARRNAARAYGKRQRPTVWKPSRPAQPADRHAITTVGVIRVGETSCTFAFSTVVVGGEPDDPAAPREVSAEGRVVVVHAPDPRGGAQPWPDDVRSLLESDRALVSY